MLAPLDEHHCAGFAFARKDATTVSVSDRWCAMKSITPEDVVGERWYATIHPEDLARVEEAWQSAVANERDFICRYRCIDPAGTLTWLEASATPVSGANGDASLYSICCNYINQAKQSQVRMRLYEVILAHSPDFAYVFGADLRIIYANDAYLKILGRTWEHTVGKTWFELGYEQWHAEMHQREMETVIQTKSQWRGEVPFTGTQGRRIYDYIFMPVLDVNGEVEAVVGTTRDVTERKQAEERAVLLSELAARLAPLTDETEILRITLEMLGRYLGAHRAYFTECSRSENRVSIRKCWVRNKEASLEGTYEMRQFGGKEWWDIYSHGNLNIEDVTDHPLTRKNYQSLVDLGLRSFAVQPYKRLGTGTVVLVVSEDKPRRWTHDEMDLIENVAARVWPLVEQARALEAIRTSQRRLTIVADAGRVILEANTAAEMLEEICEAASGHLQTDVCLAFSPHKDGGEPIIQYAKNLSDELCHQLCEIYLARESTSSEAQLLNANDRARRLLSASGVIGYCCHPLYVDSELLGMIIFASRKRGAFRMGELEFLHTLSQYVKSAYVRLRLLENLRESDRRKDEFLATLAHELRNPLAPILTGLDILKRSQGDLNVLNRVTGIIDRQTAQMVYLIDDLLDMSRVNTGKIVLRKGLTSFSAVIQSALETSAPQVQEYGHQLHANLPSDDVMVEVDSSRMAQVIANLLSNAAKYTPPNGEIQVSAGVTGADAWVSVKDNGLGIAEDEQQSVFELFHQTSTGHKDGLGIGLTLVKALVEMHEGRVELFSEGIGKGSEFVVHLPGCVVQKPELADSCALDLGQGSKTWRVMVVDDGKGNADVLEMFVKLEGHKTAVAYGGLEAVELARAFKPDLIFMDLGMPEVDGMEAARRIRAEQPKVVFVAVSGRGREEDKHKSSEAGFRAHAVKPVTPEKVRELLNSLAEPVED